MTDLAVKTTRPKMRERCQAGPGSASRDCDHKGLRAAQALLATLGLLFIAGCQRAPSYSILGSFFPVWIFCFIAGILLTLLVHFTLEKLELGGLLVPGLLVYPSMTALFTMTLWLIFYS